jgi:small-conductance mechanosensitive channel
MLLQTATATVLDETATRLLTNLTEALPTVIAGLAFLVVASLAVVVLTWGIRLGLTRALPAAEPAYRQFVVRLASVFLWFGVGLGFLTVLGLEEIAAALGTASGFVALGVAYALSGMIADAVAGIYLLRDPDFNPGDEVVVGDMTGVVETIELRKTRFAVDGDTVVRGNADIEKRWLKRGPPAD